jgi:hypothetical protein
MVIIMTIERELLKEVLEYFDPLGLNTEHCEDLPERIKELLAQPEQTEQEPEFNFNLERMKGAIESPISDVTVEDLMKQTEQDVYQKLLRIEDGITVEILPSELWLDGYKAGKRAMQKREPLSIEEIHNGLDGNNGYDDRFVDGVRFAEKHNGIGGGNE